MPVTPFHFGVGLAAKATTPRRVSFTAFVASQVLIDCESAYYLWTQQYPVHRVLHTFIVAVPFSVAVGAAVAFAYRAWRRGSRSPSEPAGAEAALRPAVIGGAIGGVTHPLLDGIMHPDIRPFWPFSQANPLLGMLNLRSLHLLCVVLGIGGLLVLRWRNARS